MKGKEGVEVVEGEGCEEGGVISVKRVWLVGCVGVMSVKSVGVRGVRSLAVEKSM